MLQIITKIPVFVFPLFVVLLIGGLKARKNSTVPLIALILIPSLFFCGSLVSFFSKYATSLSAIIFWFISLGLGFTIGFLHTQKLKLRFDKNKKKVDMPGSWIPLMLSMSIFSLKFSTGMVSAIMPQLSGSTLFISLELCATIILGIFAGRGVNCLMRYKASPNDSEIKGSLCS